VDVMAPILANKSIQERLVQYLPDASEILSKDEKELRTTLTTPQFKKAMSSFGSALQSGQLGPLMKQFNLPESVTLAAAQGNLEGSFPALYYFQLFNLLWLNLFVLNKKKRSPKPWRNGPLTKRRKMMKWTPNREIIINANIIS
jgi:hypothetical protein